MLITKEELDKIFKDISEDDLRMICYMQYLMLCMVDTFTLRIVSMKLSMHGYIDEEMFLFATYINEKIQQSVQVYLDEKEKEEEELEKEANKSGDPDHS